MRSFGVSRKRLFDLRKNSFRVSSIPNSAFRIPNYLNSKLKTLNSLTSLALSFQTRTMQGACAELSSP